MKKFLLGLALILMCGAATFAQDNNDGGNSRGNGTEMRQRMRQRLKDELKLTDVQTDSVEAIQRRHQMQMRDVRENSSLGDSDKKTRIDNINTERRKELKSVLTDDQIAKLDSMMENMRKMREDRQGTQKVN